jgi:hypothetical protein
MTRTAIALVAFLIAGIPACIIVKPRPRAYSYSEADVLKVVNPETPGSVHGQVFAKTVGGDVKTGAGEAVFALPATSYAREEVEASLLGKKLIEPVDLRIGKWSHSATIDAGGNFHMDLLPSGTWIIYSKVIWWAPTGLYGSLEQQGGPIMKDVVILPGQNVEVFLNR